MFEASETYTNEEIADSIYLAEGGKATTYPYGIKSLKYENRDDKGLSREAWARHICINTIRNNKKRYYEWGYTRYDTFLEFLASRYCPVGCGNDRGNNKYWLKNVKYFLSK